MLPSLPQPFGEAARTARDLGFHHIDVVALADRSPDDLETLADTGLLVQCTPLGRGLPDGQSLDAADLPARRAALETVKRQLADAALLGADTAYLVPGLDASREALRRFADALQLLADEAARRMIRLCLEPVPGRALPTHAGVLQMLAELDHPQLALLLDIGHCLITAEDPVAVIQQAGPRLGYVHLDDNDGIGDLHWPLCTGKLTRQGLSAFLEALRQHDYAGRVALELNPNNPDPVAALREGRELVMQTIG
jgi:hydroxypyruvate isomerase